MIKKYDGPSLEDYSVIKVRTHQGAKRRKEREREDKKGQSSKARMKRCA